MIYIVKKIESIELFVQCPSCGKNSYVDILIDEEETGFDCAYCNKSSDVDLSILFQAVCANVMVD